MLVEYWLYDKIFGNEFNIGFYYLKKDVCIFCDLYEKIFLGDKGKKIYEYEKYLERK